jgi:hypothetical protein
LQQSKLNFYRRKIEMRTLTKICGNAKLIEGVQITLDNTQAHNYIVDLPRNLGTGLGASPLELCVMSHTGTLFEKSGKNQLHTQDRLGEKNYG